MRRLAILCVFIVLPVLTACESIPFFSLPTPQNTGERYVYAVGAFEASLMTIDKALDKGLLEPGDDTALAIESIIGTVEEALKQAGLAIKDEDDITATEWLQVALAGIGELQRSRDRIWR